jgi:aminoglycoside phosphotransferase (APT) family kinase protein
MSVVEAIGTAPAQGGLEARLARFISAEMAAGADVSCRLEQIPGGASRMTYRVRYRVDGGAEHAAILRMIPPSGGFTGETMSAEVRIVEALQATKVPVPGLIAWSDDGSWLGGPFLLVEEVPVGDSAVDRLFSELDAVRPHIGERMWRILGELGDQDPVALGLIDAADAPDAADVWRLEFDYVQSRVDTCADDPLVQYLLSWLERHVPPPGRLSIVHGDFRPANFLFTDTGEVPLLMDWELWRLGDSIFDLVYSIRTTWQGPTGEHVIPPEDAIRLWEQATGRTLDPASRHWYEVAERAAGFGTIARMRDEYFRAGGRESLTYFLALRSLSSTWPRIRQLVDLPEPTIGRPEVGEDAAGDRLATFVRLAGDRYRSVVAPALGERALRSSMDIDGRILGVVADRLENGAQLLVDDNAEIESVLAASAVAVGGELAERLTGLIEARTSSVRLGRLEERNRELCRGLIAVHRRVIDDDALGEIAARVRQCISNRTERFVLPMQLFA